MRARCLEIRASGQRTQNQPTSRRTNHSTSGGRYAEGASPSRSRLRKISTPFSLDVDSSPPRRPSTSPGPLPPSHPFRPLLPRCSRTPLHLSPTTTASACIDANLPRLRERGRGEDFFICPDSFRPRDYPTPPRDGSRRWWWRRRASRGCSRRPRDSASSV
ncbi:hypothetical protein PUN28_009692 [Cardiocondyla obscurior]|uniref:Uncharacterized protein n=1 Tax=Cardiocondyla obscurior TaxID=286306 RepID=A0AAW2FW01_9HYME